MEIEKKKLQNFMQQLTVMNGKFANKVVRTGTEIVFRDEVLFIELYVRSN